MRAALVTLGCIVAGATVAVAADDWLDQVDEALSFSTANDLVRVRVSGSVDLEGYAFQQPVPGLIYSDDNTLVVPRLTLFLDAQLGPQVYVFTQARADDGFDPGDGGSKLRLDEYAVRFTPWTSGIFNLQVGKFATVVGNWVPRHYVWDNPFVTAPLPYENLTGIFDAAAAGSADLLLKWGGVRPSPAGDEGYFRQYRVPVIWGPSYASGAAVTGVLGRIDYAVEIKNASLSSRPETWDAAQTQWQHPTFSGRLGFRPDEMWNFGFSASSGSYLLPSAEPTLAAGRGLDDYRETVLGQDIGFAWHHLQFWAEFYETRFAIPEVGDADTFAYYFEAKYKFTPQFSGAVRWNQQVFGTVPDGANGPVRWGRNVWRIDLAPGYRFTPHLQVKLQYSLEHGETDDREFSSLVAGQIVLRF
jgi:hypothetical protein